MNLLNVHGKGYLWKRLGTALVMEKNLAENGIINEKERFLETAEEENDWLPAIYLYFSDDLTVL